MKYWMCLECRRQNNQNGGWYRSESQHVNSRLCPTNPTHGNMWGPYDTSDPRLPTRAEAQVRAQTHAHARAQANWNRLVEKVGKITAGSFRGSLHLSPDYYLEMLDPEHRYGPEVKLLYDQWAAGSRQLLFLDWLARNTQKIDKRIIQCTAEQREKYHKIKLEGRRICLPPKFPKDWTEAIRRGKENKLIFVMDRNTCLYAGIKKRGSFQHSSFFCGKPVKMAGELIVDQNLNIIGVTNASGHYAPTRVELVDFLKRLIQTRIDLSTVRLRFWDGRNWAYIGDALTWLRSNS